MHDIHTEASDLMATVFGYSESDLAGDLKRWWDEQVANDADPFADPKPPKAGTIFEVVPIVDSLGVVNALLTIEKHVGFEVPARVIKRGGYGSCEEMINDLLPKVRDLTAKKRKKEAA